MTTAPYVELRFNPTDLRPRDLPHAGTFLGTPADAIESGLVVARTMMANQMREELKGIAQPTQAQLLRIADLSWQAVFWKYRKVSAPIMADAYIRAYRAAEAGDVPMSVIYDLAEKHAEKIGDYFHESSRAALADGFNALVNRRLPAKAAADRVMDAYGLTPRQMRTYVAAKQFDTPISDVMPRSIKARARAYIDKAFIGRVRKLSAQEEHNIDEQAKQYAWMWLQDKGRLSKKAQKLWITAKDERVCKICGPLHGKKVGINQQFVTAQGAFWSPGLHPNCRCVIRLIENKFSKALAAADLIEFNQEHPRAQTGRFSAKARTKTIDVDQEFDALVRGQGQGPTALARSEVATPETDRAFRELIEAQPRTRATFTSPFTAVAPAEVITQAKVDTAKPEFKTYVDQLKLTVAPPELKTEFITELVLDTRQAVKLDAKVEAPIRMKPPTTKLDHEAYAVITRENLKDGDITRLNLDHGITFSTDEIAMAMEASEVVERMVDAGIQKVKQQNNTLVMIDNKSGETIRAVVDEQDVSGMLEWLARTATIHHRTSYDPTHDPDSMGDNKVHLDWYDKSGHRWIHEDVPYSNVARRFGLNQEDFEVYMVRTDEAHQGEGTLEDVSGSSHSRHRSYTMEGQFEWIPESMNWSGVDQTYGVTTYKITPAGIHEDPSE